MTRESPHFLRVCVSLALAFSLGIPLAALAKPPRPPPASAAKKKNGKERPPPKERTKEAPGEIEDEPPPPAPAAAQPAEEGRALQRGERVEFDGRLIQGQTAKAGAVYLFARVSTNLRSMVKERSSFKDKIVRTVFPDDSPVREEEIPAQVEEKKEEKREEKKEEKPPVKAKGGRERKEKVESSDDSKEASP
jgi:hypothetical protein